MAGRTSYDRAYERGITQRHESHCRARDGKRCTCRTPAFIAAAMVDGERRRSPTLRSLDAARKWRRQALTGELPEHHDDKPTQTLEAAWRAFVRDAEKGVALTKAGTPYKPRALKDYDSAITVHVLKRIGGTPLSRVDSPEVQRLLDALARDGVSPSRQHAVATALRTLTRWASRRGEGVRVAGLELPRVAQRKPVVLGPVEAEALIAKVDAPDARLFAALALYTGARATEIAALKPRDIDRDALEIRLAEDAAARKSPAAQRTVPILAPLLPHLDAYRPRRSMFGTGTLRARYDRLYLATRSAWSGLDPRPTPHTLRHNYISWLFAAGVPLPAAQRLSGHETPLVPGVTLAVYGHATSGHVAEARKTLDAWIVGQAEGQS